MVSFPDHGRQSALTQKRARKHSACALSRAIKGLAGIGLCMAALGLWLVPSFDAAAQLSKLCGSLLLLGVGAYLFHMRKEPDLPLPVEDSYRAKPVRVREYDARGQARIRGA